MALTIVERSSTQGSERGQMIGSDLGNLGQSVKLHVSDITFDSSYPTGGEAVTAAQLGFTTLLHVLSVEIIQAAVTDHIVRFDATNSKLLAQVISTGAQVADTTDLSAITCRVVSLGLE